MARKFYGSFTPDAAKVLKKADRICCRVDDDGTVYVTDGCIAYKMAPAEYAAIVQPVVCCEAGNWYIQGGEKRDNNGFDVIGIFRQSVEATANLSPMEQCPLTLTAGKDKTAAAYYNAESDFVALYNTRYTAALCPGFSLRAANGKSAAVAYSSNDPFAIILPIKCDDKTKRAVKAYFGHDGSDDNGTGTDELREKLAHLQDKLNRANAEANELRERVHQQADELETLRTANETAGNKTDSQESAPDAKTAAEIIAARWSAVDGVTVTVKGAQTASPVVWLTGSTKNHTKEIEAAGGHWSHKKSAYYFRIA